MDLLDSYIIQIYNVQPKELMAMITTIPLFSPENWGYDKMPDSFSHSVITNINVYVVKPQKFN